MCCINPYAINFFVLDEKEKRRQSDSSTNTKTGGFFKQSKSYNPDEEARHISDLTHEQNEAEKKLREDVERVKTELFEFDTNRFDGFLFITPIFERCQKL